LSRQSPFEGWVAGGSSGYIKVLLAPTWPWTAQKHLIMTNTSVDCYFRLVQSEAKSAATVAVAMKKTQVQAAQAA
jgi:hypothetical protein